MLPKKFQKQGGFPVNLPTEFGRIELEIQVHEPRFGFQGNITPFQDTLVRHLGCIISFDGLVANPFFSNQFEGRLKEFDIEP